MLLTRNVDLQRTVLIDFVVVLGVRNCATFICGDNLLRMC